MLIWVLSFSPGVMSEPNLTKALFGTSLTMADGVLTASVSVTSAVGGIGELLQANLVQSTQNSFVE
jgi:K+ transporter